MQALSSKASTASRPMACAPRASRMQQPCKRSVSVIACKSHADTLRTVGTNIVMMGAALTLVLAPPADAKLVEKKPTKFQKEQAYQEELLQRVRSRTGKGTVLPELKGSPTTALAARDVPAPELSGPVKKVTKEAVAGVPTPDPVPADPVPTAVSVPGLS